jgi:NAD(P)-dependent dehydrogenase (short-subunit alcohol dehydrogenase family)
MATKVALVTGASSGIGEATAIKLNEAGFTTYAAARRVERMDHLKKLGIRPIAMDVTDDESMQAGVQQIVSESGRIDVLVNNAGIIYREAIVDTSTETFRSAIETDLVSQFMLAREVGRHMLGRKYGRIVNISSIMGILGRATVAGYVAAKHGLIGLTKNLAAEYGPDVTCNAIAPGYIRTELNVPLQQNKAFNAMLEQRTAAHRWGKPEDLRGPLLLLASDAGAYMTGHTLVVDGGMTVILG